jgi:membrane protein insertase Oxa1/YidC/SpoIIIJ
VLVHGAAVAQPRYIPHSSKMYHNLIATNGAIKAFGLDLNLKPFPISGHGSVAGAIPFFLFVAAAVGLQYFQMAQLNKRSMKQGQAIPSQTLAMQRIMPIFFAYFYMVIPAAVVLYMIISTLIRIITQDLMFRAGLTTPKTSGSRELPAVEAKSTNVEAKPAPTKPSTQSRSKSKRKRKAR